LSGKDGAEVGLALAYADTTAVGDGDGVIMEGILQIRQSSIKAR
jgi:hypothetical protein